jgi:hypothetical protein
MIVAIHFLKEMEITIQLNLKRNTFAFQINKISDLWTMALIIREN